MNLEECYKLMGGNLEDTIKRIDNVKLITTIVRSFPNDPSFNELKTAYENKDVDLAFRAAHTLKGICLNLGFDQLSKDVCEITEIFRSKTFDGSEELYKKICDNYSLTISAISNLD